MFTKVRKYSTRKRLVKRIKKDLNIECDPATFRKISRGYWQKRAGQWAWQMQTADYTKTLGGIDTVTEILRSKSKLVTFDIWGSYIEITLDE